MNYYSWKKWLGESGHLIPSSYNPFYLVPMVANLSCLLKPCCFLHFSFTATFYVPTTSMKLLSSGSPVYSMLSYLLVLFLPSFAASEAFSRVDGFLSEVFPLGFLLTLSGYSIMDPNPNTSPRTWLLSHMCVSIEFSINQCACHT